MGFACPVCEEPQADETHLANHLAFTAILRGGDHESWLDEHVPHWDEQTPAELGPDVAEHATEIEVEIQSSEEQSRPERPAVEPTREPEPREFSDADREILEKARALTRERLENREGSEKE